MNPVSSLNAKQQEAVVTTEGRVLIEAGPGTGKTKTLVHRTLYLLQEKGIAPSQIIITTFTNKAAQEIEQRLIQEYQRREAPYRTDALQGLASDCVGDSHSVSASECRGSLVVPPPDWHVGTFHNLAREIIEQERPEDASRIVLSYLAQKLFFLRHAEEMEQQIQKKFPNFHWALCPSTSSGLDTNANEGAEHRPPCHLSEEEVRFWVRQLDEWRESCFASQQKPSTVTIQGRKIPVSIQKECSWELVRVWMQTLQQYGRIDYSGQLFEAWCILRANARSHRNQPWQGVQYVMVDEFQDTNPIQLQMLQLLGVQNICAIGDSNQLIYGFRGASKQTIHAFSSKACHRIQLPTNYRSNPAIVHFAENYLASCHMAMEQHHVTDTDSKRGKQHAIEHGALMAHRTEDSLGCVRYLSIALPEEAKNWTIAEQQEQYEFRLAQAMVQQMQLLRTRLQSWGSIAVLSFQNESPLKEALKQEMARQGVPFYSPSMRQVQEQVFEALQEVLSFDRPEENPPFTGVGQAMDGKEPSMDALSWLYEQLGTSPRFRTWLEQASRMEQGEEQSRAQVIAEYVRSFQEFCQQYGHEQLTHECFAFFLQDLKTIWIPYLQHDRGEYREATVREDCVSLLTTHKSKGLEFPVVFFLEEQPTTIRTSIDGVPLFSVDAEEERIDRNYVALTRAMDLLILCPAYSTAWGGRKDSNKTYRSNRWAVEHAVLPTGLLTPEFFPDFHEKFATPLFARYAFTADLAVYETCPRLYFYTRWLHLPQTPAVPQRRGTLFHAVLHELFTHSWDEVTQDLPWSVWISQEMMRQNQRFEAIGSGCSASECEDVLQRIQKFLESPYFAPCYESARRARENQQEVSEIAVHRAWRHYEWYGVMDFWSKEVGMVDFKTGNLPDEEHSEQYQQYRDQLRFYALLSGAFEDGDYTQSPEDLPAHLYFFTPDATQVLEVPLTDMNSFIQRMEHVVEQVEAQVFEKTTDGKKCSRCLMYSLCYGKRKQGGDTSEHAN